MPEKTFKLILGSQSPRRKELLSYLGLPFEIHTADLEEISKHIDPVEVVKDLALQKGKAVLDSVRSKYDGEISPVVISSDTIVCLGETIYNKPVDRADAKRILQELSGKSHIVRTAVAFSSTIKLPFAFVVETKVTFDQISPELLEIYLDTGDSLDKAGAYGIQGPSLSFISKVEGSYSAVVGFPLSDVVSRLKEYMASDNLGQCFV
tara:strand:+ start:14118 stop:14738 length:621 start_codon:yes stop_codon:yes gene_type:complete